ncbi:acVLRF1 family peptidyl-tRNA hydrolase [Arthrobacter sp. NPDC058130]|uniref:acVLRF1 family peptidyl-tRNA hydrolase n=1 Tax=Arthrobacter sp. NPDC058130 TaxID=3346353 RepID=UPI0036EF7C22
MPSPETRLAFVSGARLPGWVDRFAASHGALTQEQTDAGLQLRAADGTEAVLRAPWPVDGRPGTGPDAVSRLASLAGQPRSIGAVLVRRGGYSVAVVSAGAVLASKTGTRHVQSRTAAGGWSQQRFARRRANQADALVEAVAEHAARIFAGHRVEYVAPGGDRTLAEQVLAEPVLKRYAGLARLAFLDVPDPRAAILKKAATDLCSVRILVTDPE